MGILFAILASLTTAIGDTFIKKAYKTFSPFASFVVVSVFGLLIWPLSAFFVKFEPSMLFPGLIYGLISGFLGQGYYIYALSKGELSITGTLLSTFPVFTIIFSVILNNESFTITGLLSIILMIVGTIIVALPDKKTSEKIKLFLIIMPLSAALGIGFSDTLSKGFINAAGAGTFLVATALMQFFASVVCMALAKEKFANLAEPIKHPRTYINAILGSFFIAIAILFVFLAFEFVNASIAAPIIGTAPIFIVILAATFLKEKISRKNITGIVLVLIGILAASF